MNNTFLGLECRLTHKKHHNKGGNKFSAMEFIGVLYPEWDCNEWDVELLYKEDKKKFTLYAAAEMGRPDLNDILTTIFKKDYSNVTRPMFIKNKGYEDYNEFFAHYAELYGEVDKILSGIWDSGVRVRGLLFKLLKNKEFHELKNYVELKMASYN